MGLNQLYIGNWFIDNIFNVSFDFYITYLGIYNGYFTHVIL